MKKIETLEELITARKQLITTARQMESELQTDFKYFSGHIQPVLSFFDGSRSSGTVSSLLVKGVAAFVPLLLSKQKVKTSTPPAASPWATLSSIALGLLASGQVNNLVSKIGSFLGSFGQKERRARRKRHSVDKDSINE